MFPLQKQMVNSYIVSPCGFTGHIFSRAGETPARVSLPPTMVPRNANHDPDPPEQPKRPQVLNYPGRRYHDGEEDDGGSLPNTPDQECEASVSGGHPRSEALDDDTTEFLKNFFRNFVGISKCRENKYISTANRVVNDVLEKHRFAYNGMITKLSLDDKGDDMSFVSGVAKSLFADGTTNWGRIASLLAFGAAVCQYLKDQGRGQCVDLVSQEISTYLLQRQRDWLVNNNSWDGFVEFFRVSDPESTVRKTLVTCLGIAGLGALLAQLSR